MADYDQRIKTTFRIANRISIFSGDKLADERLENVIFFYNKVESPGIIPSGLCELR